MTVFDQAASFLFTAGMPRPPETNPDLRAQALELVDSPGRLRAAWTEIRHRMEDEGFEADEFAMICQVYLNLLDNCAIVLEASGRSFDQLQLSSEKLRSVVAEVKVLQDELRPLYELAPRKASPLDPVKLAAAQRKNAGEPAVEVGELLRQIQAGEVEL